MRRKTALLKRVHKNDVTQHVADLLDGASTGSDPVTGLVCYAPIGAGPETCVPLFVAMTSSDLGISADILLQPADLAAC